MINQSTRYVVCLGLLAGSLAISPTARAEISVTGGRTSGDAAFFVPGATNTTTTTTTGGCGCDSTSTTSATSTSTSGGDTVLFDARIRQLRLETSAGVTVNSRFTPTAGRLDSTTGVPKGGETGQLQGLLSGRAFTAAGNPVFFQNVRTTLDFKLNSFAPDTLIGGTLISPITSASGSNNTSNNTSTNTSNNTSTNTSTSSTDSSAPPIFLPITGVTLAQESATSFEAKDGQLYVGKFDANLPSGSIALPSGYRFTAGSTTPNLPPSTPIGSGNTKFKFDGQGQGTTTFASTTGTNSTIDFDSASSKTNFQVEGTGFKVQGTSNGPTDFKLGGINSTGVTGNIAFKGDTKFTLEGQGVGTTQLDTATGELGYKSTEANTKFKIEVGANKLEGNSVGEAEINVGGIGISSTGSTTTTGGTTTGSTTGGTTGGTTTGGTTGTTTGSTTTTTGGASSGTASGSFTAQTTYIQLFTVDSLSTSQVAYVVSPSNNDDDNDDDDDDNELEVRRNGNEGRGRGRRVARGRQNRTTYVLVGPSSRVFPGLVGLRQLPPASSTTSTTESESTTESTESTTGTSTTESTGTTESTTGTSTTESTTSTTESGDSTTTDTTESTIGTTGTTGTTTTEPTTGTTDATTESGATTGTTESTTGTTGITSTDGTTSTTTSPATGTSDDSTTINFSSPAGTGTVQFTPVPSTNP